MSGAGRVWLAVLDVPLQATEERLDSVIPFASQHDSVQSPADGLYFSS